MMCVSVRMARRRSVETLMERERIEEGGRQSGYMREGRSVCRSSATQV